MEKLKKKKTGFTLVELLVVIAILAVLASVSVIGYLSFVKKAKVSNDSSLITQMNTTLQANEAVDGKNATAHDAIEELYESGLDVNKLSPTTEGYHYAIDMSQNRAFLLDGDYNKVAPENLSISSNKEDVFVMISSYDQISTVNDEGYSVYLKNGFDWGTQTSKEITTSKGIDVGDNEVTTINYVNDNEQTVITRSDSYSTTLNVHAPNDIVKHYGKGKEINITQVAGKSYHEYGNILGNIKFAQGNVEVESGASVSNVVINSVSFNATVNETTNTYSGTPSSDDTTVEIKENVEINSVQYNSSESETFSSNEFISGTGASNVTKVNLYNNDKKAIIGDTAYSSLSEAVNAAKGNEVVTLIKDETIDDVINIKSEKEITINLNDHKIASSNNETFYVSGKLTINGNGTIENTKSNEKIAYGIYIKGGTCIMNGGDIVSKTANKGTGVVLFFDDDNQIGSNFIMNGGSIEGAADGFSLSVNNVKSYNSVVSINYGVLKGEVYWPCDGTLTFGTIGGRNSDVIVTGKNALELVCGTITINCGTFTGTLGDGTDSTSNMKTYYIGKSGSVSSGDAVTVVYNRNATYAAARLDVIINDGIFIYDGEENSLRVIDCTNSTSTQAGSLVINSGTYNGNVDYETAKSYVTDKVGLNSKTNQ